MDRHDDDAAECAGITWPREHLWDMTVLSSRLGDAVGDLVSQAAAGDEAAFTRIVAAHHDDMVRVSFVVCGDVDLAEEAVAAAWLIAWRKLGDLREPIDFGRGSYRSPRTRHGRRSAGAAATVSSSWPWPTPGGRRRPRGHGPPTST